MIDTADSYVLQTPSGGWFVSRDPRDLIKVLQIEIDKKASQVDTKASQVDTKASPINTKASQNFISVSTP